MVSRRVCVVSLAWALSVAILAGLGHAQDEKRTEAKSPGKEEVKGRLPLYFGQIGLSKKQEDEIRKAAQSFDEQIVKLKMQIAELEKQIDSLDGEKVVACEKLLSDGQKNALKARREQAESERASKKRKTSNDGVKAEDKKP